MYKHKAETETHDPKKGATSLGLKEVLDTPLQVARTWWPAAFAEHRCLQWRWGEIHSDPYCLSSAKPPKKRYYTDMTDNVNL